MLIEYTRYCRLIYFRHEMKENRLSITVTDIRFIRDRTKTPKTLFDSFVIAPKTLFDFNREDVCWIRKKTRIKCTEFKMEQKKCNKLLKSNADFCTASKSNSLWEMAWDRCLCDWSKSTHKCSITLFFFSSLFSFLPFVFSFSL